MLVSEKVTRFWGLRVFFLNRKILYKRHGFSLTELMITCIIIVILVGLAVPSYWTSRLRAEEQKAIAALSAFAQAQKSYWFEQSPNTYTNIISDLTPSYVDLPTDDGDWVYSVTGDANTFIVLAEHKDFFGALDGLQLQIDDTGSITRIGAWPY